MQKATVTLPRTSGYSKPMVKACLKTTFSPYTEETLLSWSSQLTADPRFLQKFQTDQNKKVLIISPSTVFAASWQAAVNGWLAGFKIVIKPSSRESIFPELLSESIQALGLASHLPVQILSPVNPPKWESFHRTIVYGSDETIKAIGQKLPRNKKVIGFGSKFSIGIIGRQWDWKTVKNAAKDSVLYETQGCLSPQCFFVPKGTSQKFGRSLSREIKKLNRTFPAFRDPDREEERSKESFYQHWTFRESQGEAQLFSDSVILDRTTRFMPCGLKRTVFVREYNQSRDIDSQIGDWAPKVSTVGVDTDDVEKQVRKLFPARSDIRLCKIGKMHEPPPDWKNGGIDLLSEL